MARNITFTPPEYYHLYNRGTEKREIFLDSRDYFRFLTLLYLANSQTKVDLKLQGRTLYELADFDRGETLVDLCTYVLMPNHYHLLVREKSEGGISTFMRKLGTAYTMYFNAKYDRSGALFQGKFKAKHIDNDLYLQYVFSYIHINPVAIIEADWKETQIQDKTRAREHIHNYAYSSFKDYCGEIRIENKIIDIDSFPTDLNTPRDFDRMVSKWLQGPTL